MVAEEARNIVVITLDVAIVVAEEVEEDVAVEEGEDERVISIIYAQDIEML